ncbi:uncharacterized protein ACNS7B_021452 [Menidia menidia]
MCAETECGICYRSYNAGRRCPRELRCRHSFCESCLRAMARPGAHGRIDCPLCRQPTPLSGEEDLRAQLRVDEVALERLMAEGLLDREEEEEDEEEDPEEEDPEDRVQTGEGGRDVAETQAEEGDSSPAPGGGRFRRSWRKVWSKISGKSAWQGRDACMTNEELRSMAMMSCYMF